MTCKKNLSKKVSEVLKKTLHLFCNNFAFFLQFFALYQDQTSVHCVELALTRVLLRVMKFGGQISICFSFLFERIRAEKILKARLWATPSDGSVSSTIKISCARLMTAKVLTNRSCGWKGKQKGQSSGMTKEGSKMEGIKGNQEARRARSEYFRVDKIGM